MAEFKIYKFLYLHRMELTDKQEPPGFATCESYGVAIAFACLSDFVLSLVQISRGNTKEGVKGNFISSITFQEFFSCTDPFMFCFR